MDNPMKKVRITLMRLQALSSSVHNAPLKMLQNVRIVSHVGTHSLQLLKRKERQLQLINLLARFLEIVVEIMLLANVPEELSANFHMKSLLLMEKKFAVTFKQANAVEEPSVNSSTRPLKGRKFAVTFKWGGVTELHANSGMEVLLVLPPCR